MKKILVVIMTLAFVMPVANAQNSKALDKALKKEYKAKMKEYKKGGYKLFGSTRSFDVALLKHYEKLDALGANGQEVVGIATRCKSLNVGKQMAMNNACITYAQQAGSVVKGRIVADLAGDGINTDAEFEHFYAAYERLVEKEIKGEMQESFSIIKDLGNNEHEVQTYFIINEDAASKARIRAMENALRESEAAQKYATKVSEFVRQGFENK